MHICENLNITDKLAILTAAAKYDVACTSSGTERGNNGRGIGNAVKSGICHAFAADGRCISLLKILFTNECVFDCKYCANRASNDVVRTSFTPKEVCTLTMEFYRRNYIEGLFLSSGVLKNPTYTMGLLYETVRMLREEYNFGGYIHVKGIPGAAAELIDLTGWYADRMSVNLELPTSEGLKAMAPNKSRKTILAPMKQIQNGITAGRPALSDGKRTCGRAERILPKSEAELSFTGTTAVAGFKGRRRSYVPAGQSTQMIIGATPENDYQIVSVAEALYKKYELKRVFYSAFVNVNRDSSLPAADGGAPLLREHRLYQADWLLRFYGFGADDLLSQEKPYFNVFLDPKCDWALRHLELFPIEINRADYYSLLKVPGVGVNSAKRIVKARRSAPLDFSDIKKMGVVLKRALYFITCSGKMMYKTKLEEDYIVRNLLDDEHSVRLRLGGEATYRQLSFFDAAQEDLPRISP
ncbi:MAG: putative DNA modification/repair radical SAM protein [Butyrivibrio sp.]|nr:putative DNA modification/repair radical SAM protein [Butyrivibrio sp.]